MSYNLLDLDLQNILFFNYELFSKIFWLLLIIGGSAIYSFYIKPNQDKTSLLSEAIIRILFNAFSYVSLLASPLLIFFGLNPTYNYADFIIPYFIIYVIGITIYLLGIIGDMLRYGIPILLEKVGFSMNDEDTRIAYKKYERFFNNGR